MRSIAIQLLLLLAALTPRAQAGDSSTNRFAVADPQARTQVTCKPVYYQRYSDGSLVPAEAAAQIAGFEASGILFSVVKPTELDGQVVAFHFDYPKKWDRLYKPGVLYSGLISTCDIGRLAFMCDPGWRSVSTNRLSGAPNESGSTNRSQPGGPGTNGTPRAAGSGR